jgi:hypothetical protein
MANWTALLGSLLLFCPFLLADQVVYLDRPGAVSGDGHTLWEPYFNPKSLNAAVGEVIQFVARFDNIQSRPLTAKSRLFTPLIASILRPTDGHSVNRNTAHLAFITVVIDLTRICC